MRLFTAFELPDEVRAAWQEAQDTLRRRIDQARWSPAAQAHLTLHFLGEQPADRLEAIVAACRTACRAAAPFRLGLGRAGAFPSARRARVLWLGVTGDLAALEALEEANRKALAAAGVTLEDRRYHPHLTLAREPRDGAAAAAAIPLIEVAPVSWQVETLVVFRSTLAPGGAIHEPLARLALGNG